MIKIDEYNLKNIFFDSQNVIEEKEKKKGLF